MGDDEWPAYECCGRKSLHSRRCANAAQQRYWNGTRRGLDALCKWANSLVDEPALTYNFTDDGWWDAPVLETEHGHVELRNGDYVVFADGEFNVRRLGYDENRT
jgi:hypothetical protein